MSKIRKLFPLVVLYIFSLNLILPTTAQGSLQPFSAYVVLNCFTNDNGNIHYKYTLNDGVNADVYVAIYDENRSLAGITINNPESTLILEKGKIYSMKLMLFEPNTLTPICKPATDKDVNVVVNPGYENGAANWDEWHNTSINPNAVTYIDTNGPHSGTSYRSHWATAAYEQSTSQVITGLTNGIYNMTVWVKSGGGFDQILLIAKNYGDVEKDTSIPTSAFGWTQYTIQNISVSNGQCQIDFYTKAPAGTHWIGFDDVLLTLTNRQLLWSDEFNYTGLPDGSKWGYDTGLKCRNDELQMYTKSNATCDGSNLIIEARKNDTYNGKQYSYTSTSMKTIGKVSFGKGYYEMRGKVPIANGMWPAWWTLGNNSSVDGWPYCGEIDMMECYIQPNTTDQFYTLLNVMDSKGTWTSKKIPVTTSFADIYHTWGMLIDDNYIRLYLDGIEKVTYSQSSAWNGTYNPFLSQEMYMLLDLAVGGTSGGDPTNTTFPQRFYVDYVRYYSLGY